MTQLSCIIHPVWHGYFCRNDMHILLFQCMDPTLGHFCTGCPIPYYHHPLQGSYTELRGFSRPLEFKNNIRLHGRAWQVPVLVTCMRWRPSIVVVVHRAEFIAKTDMEQFPRFSSNDNTNPWEKEIHDINVFIHITYISRHICPYEA